MGLQHTSGKYNYRIESHKLVPPMVHLKFFAVVRMYEGTNEVQTQIGETMGETAGEAEAKMNQLVEKWLKDNQ